MKKYVKPEISFQNLNLSTNISAGCEISSNQAALTCGVELPGYPGLIIFQDDSTGTCDAYMPGIEDSICYHVPVADSNVFES